MRILIVGAGGAGGYFGARWALSGLDVTFLARGAQLEAIRHSGLEILSPFGNACAEVRATDAVGELGDFDLVVFATKSWQLPAAIAQVSACIQPGTPVLGLQNGVESAALLASGFPPSDVLGGTCRIISMIESPGVIRHLGVDPTILIGEPDGGLSERVLELQSALHLGEGLTVIASAKIQLEIWLKFIFFAPVSGIGSVTRSPIGALRGIDESRRILESAMHEVFAVGKAEGLDLDDGTVAKTMAFIDTLPPDGTSSMQRDIEAGRRSELEALAGAVVTMGRRNGVPTPVHEFIYASLLPMETRVRETG